MQYILQDLLRLPLKERLEIIERSIDTQSFEKGQERLLTSLFDRLLQLKGLENSDFMKGHTDPVNQFRNILVKS